MWPITMIDANKPFYRCLLVSQSRHRMQSQPLNLEQFISIWMTLETQIHQVKWFKWTKLDWLRSADKNNFHRQAGVIISKHVKLRFKDIELREFVAFEFIGLFFIISTNSKLISISFVQCTQFAVRIENYTWEKSSTSFTSFEKDSHLPHTHITLRLLWDGFLFNFSDCSQTQ